MTTWYKGRARVRDIVQREGMALDQFLETVGTDDFSHRIPGTAVFLTATPTTVPRALLSNLKHNLLLHERTVFVWVETVDVPHVPTTERRRRRPSRDRLLARSRSGAASRMRPTCRWA